MTQPLPTVDTMAAASEPVALPPVSTATSHDSPLPFFHVLLEELREGIVFVDQHLQIIAWNSCLESMTGIGAAGVLGRVLTPQLLLLRELDGTPVGLGFNPFAQWLAANGPSHETFLAAGRSGRETQFEFHCHPVDSAEGQRLGAVLIVLDRSVQVELQRQLDHLYSQAVVDPLTQVANRAEFERLLVDYVQTHQEVGLKCSVIICDLDFFKRINDHYGHHVGDQALVAFAKLLKQYVRVQDFVARYGGEEFVILCAHCDERAAVERAEEIRQALESTLQPMLDNKTMTASFGVAELHPDDTAQSLFVSADRALLQAKETGRNCVVAAARQSAIPDEAEAEGLAPVTPSRAPPTWPDRKLSQTALCDELFGTNCPPAFMMRKVVTFCQQFAIGAPTATDCTVSFIVPGTLATGVGQGLTFRVEVDMAPPDRLAPGKVAPQHTQTLVRIALLPGRSGWFRRPRQDDARNLMREIRGFLGLIGSEYEVRSAETQAGPDAEDRYR